MQPNIPSTKQSAFSLLEVMVALVISALVCVGAFTVFSSLLRAQATIEKYGAQLQMLQLFTLRVQQDLSQATPRSHDNKTSINSSENKLEFVTTGWANPLDEKRSELAYVHYELTNNNVLRSAWPFAETDLSKPALHQVIVDSIEKITFNAIKSTSQTVSQTNFPAGYDLTYTMVPFGEIHQHILMVQAP